jgi:L-fuconolactonase
MEALAACPLVRGVRRIVQFEKDDTFCLRPDFVRGVRLLGEFGMSFDICIKGDAQFQNALQLVRACPDVRFILDHIGKPFIKEKIMEPWATHLRELAAMPNTWCKMSGLVNEADWERWQPADLRPYLDRVFDCFGFERVIFGGDWPVCTLASPYRRWFETLLDAVKGCSDAERRGLFHDNGARFYGIQEGGRT